MITAWPWFSSDPHGLLCWSVDQSCPSLTNDRVQSIMTSGGHSAYLSLFRRRVGYRGLSISKYIWLPVHMVLSDCLPVLLPSSFSFFRLYQVCADGETSTKLLLIFIYRPNSICVHLIEASWSYACQVVTSWSIRVLLRPQVSFKHLPLALANHFIHACSWRTYPPRIVLYRSFFSHSLHHWWHSLIRLFLTGSLTLPHDEVQVGLC